MRGRTLGVWIVIAVLASRAGAQVSPVPPPASRVAQTGAETKTPAAPDDKTALVEEGPPPVVPPPELPPPLTPPSWEGRTWVAMEGLVWWIQGARVPALVTTSPAGTPNAVAGLAGPATTQVLFGHQDMLSGMNFGGAFRAGSWLDDEHKYGVELGFLMTQPQSNSYGSAGNGSPILTRPFVNGITGAPAVAPISLPGVASGAFYGAYSTSGLVGTGIWFRENIANSRDPSCMCRRCGPNCDSCGADDRNGFRFDGLLGYRFLRMEEELDVDTEVTNLAPRANGPAGTRVLTTDQIHTRNTFNGVDMGINGQVYRGGFYVDMLAKAAFGATTSYADLYGAHTVNGAPQPGGGFLVQTSNFGRYNKTAGAVMPEFSLKFGYRFGDHLRVYAGYTLFYWFHVTRAGDSVDTAINPNFLNGGPIGANAVHPAFSNNNDNIWVQGVTTGIEWRY
jgi:hypothetical protein